MIPQMDGIEFCSRVRAMTDVQLHIILLTTLDNEDDIITGLEADADDYVTKAFPHWELQACNRCEQTRPSISDPDLKPP